MTVEAFAKEIGANVFCMPCPNKIIDGVYIGDLLSWVMGKADQGNLWITIMSNINTVAVATLVDVSCILLAEDVIPDPAVLETAAEKGVNLLSTSLSSYEAALSASRALS